MNANPILLLPEWLLPIRPVRQVLKDHALLIQGKLIKDIGPAAQLLEKYANVERQALPGQLLMPGLINLHSHAAMSLMRGFADDLPLERWLNERIWPAEHEVMSAEYVYDGSVLAALEMLKGGVTTFNDMYFYPEATAQAALDLGMRAQVGIVVFEFPSKYGIGPDDYIAKGLAQRDAFKGESKIGFTLAPHAPYTVSDESFKKVVALSNELDIPVHCHIHETAFEVHQSLEQTGKRPIQRLGELGLLSPNLIAVHAVHVNEAEVQVLAKTGVSIAHCPHSNLKLASGIAPVAQFLKAGIQVGIGTDGSASNNRLDLWSEGRTAALLAKGYSLDASAFDAFSLLESLTLTAAKALGRDAYIGSLEIGKCADIISLDLTNTDYTPIYDHFAHLAYLVSRDAVQDVWIDGEHVVHKRQLTSKARQEKASYVTARTLMWQNTVGEIQKRSTGA